MRWEWFVDPALCERLTVTLVHSLWQMTFIAMGAWGVDRIWARRSSEKAHLVYVVALLIGVTALPITYFSLDMEPTLDFSSPHDKALPLRSAAIDTEPSSSANVAVELRDSRDQGGRMEVRSDPSLPSRIAGEPGFEWKRAPQWIAAAYLLGVALMLCRIGIGVACMERLASSAIPLRGGALANFMQQLADAWSMRVVPAIAYTEQIMVPKVVGIIRPTILLPATALTGLSVRELEMVIAHELAHVKRCDIWMNLLQRFAEAVLFFNPAVWFLSRRLSACREYCCDELACQAMSGDFQSARTNYVHALLRVAELSRGRSSSSDVAAVAASGRRPSEFRRRVARLLGEPVSEPVRISRGGLAMMIVLVLALVALPAWRTQATPESNGKALDTGAGREFRLTVVGPGGKPVQESDVEIRSKPKLTAKHVARGSFVEGRPYGTRVRTDDEGRLDLKLPKGLGFFEVYINTDAYGPYVARWSREQDISAIPNEFTAALDAAWRVGGVLVDAEGKPIEGATVRPSIEFKKRPGDTRQFGVGATAKTDADGRWEYGRVPSGMNDVGVEIDHPDFMPLRKSLSRGVFEVGVGHGPTATVAMDRGLTVVGRVVDENGSPIADALVRAKFLNSIRKATTNADGRYTLGGCEPRVARIVVSAKGKALDMKQMRVDKEMGSVDFQMKPGGHLRVMALDAQGKPIPKTRIFFQQWRGRIEYFEFDHINTYADKNGVWEWNEAPLDEIKADICPPDGMQLTEQSLRSREEEYVFKAPPVLVVSGIVTDAKTKKPVEKFQVVPGIRANVSVGTSLQWLRSAVYSGANGRYSVTHDRQYPAHLIRIEANGYKAVVSRDIQFDEGRVTINFALERGEDVAANVLTPDGKPAAGAKVALGVGGSQISVENGDIDDSSTFHASRLDTDANGKFKFPPQETPFQIVVTHPTGYAYIKATPDSFPTTLQLIPWARIEGTFRAGDKAEPNVSLEFNSNAVHSYGPDLPSIFTHHLATTGPKGAFVFERVFPGGGRLGRRIVYMVNEGAIEVASSKMVRLDLGAGETKQVNLGGDGRAVVGKLIASQDADVEPDWHLATIRVRADIPQLPPPPIPAAAQNDAKRREAWWNEWRLTPEGRAWSELSAANQRLSDQTPYFMASVERDGTFRIDDVPSGSYRLTVSFQVRQPGQGELSKRLSVPDDQNSPAAIVDLGELPLSR